MFLRVPNPRISKFCSFSTNLHILPLKYFLDPKEPSSKFGFASTFNWYGGALISSILALTLFRNTWRKQDFVFSPQTWQSLFDFIFIFSIWQSHTSVLTYNFDSSAILVEPSIVLSELTAIFGVNLTTLNEKINTLRGELNDQADTILNQVSWNIFSYFWEQHSWLILGTRTPDSLKEFFMSAKQMSLGRLMHVVDRIMFS